MLRREQEREAEADRKAKIKQKLESASIKVSPGTTRRASTSVVQDEL